MFEIYNLFKYIVNDFEKLNMFYENAALPRHFAPIFPGQGNYQKSVREESNKIRQNPKRRILAVLVFGLST